VSPEQIKHLFISYEKIVFVEEMMRHFMFFEK